MNEMKSKIKELYGKYKKLLFIVFLFGLWLTGVLLYGMIFSKKDPSFALPGLFDATVSAGAAKLAFVIASAVLYGVLAFFFLKKRCPWWAPFILLSVLLIGFFFFLPADFCPDEGTHFYRSYEIGYGRLISGQLSDGKGASLLPYGIFTYQSREAVADWNNTAYLEIANTALYSPLNYLFQAVAIRIAELFTDHSFYLLFAGRAANVLAFLLISFFAVKQLPFGRNVAYVILFFPMTIQQAISTGPDIHVISLGMLFLATVLKVSASKEKIRIRDIVILSIAAVFLSQLKVVYIVLVFAILIIPGSRFKSKTQHVLVKTLILSVTVLLSAAWFFIARRYLIEFNEGVDSMQQVIGVLKNPAGYVKTMLKTLLVFGYEWLRNLFGYSMGNLNIQIPEFIWLSAFLILIFETGKCSRSGVGLSKKQSFVLIGITAAATLLIMASLYVQWTPVGSDVVKGVQGRYFLPVLLYLLIAVAALSGSRKTAMNPLPEQTLPAENPPISLWPLAVLLTADLAALASIMAM